MSRRPSRQTVAVLAAMATDPAAWRYGYELGQEVGLKAGSLYPILMRLGDRGLLDSTWETDPPAGPPPRHLYRLTADGTALAAGAGAGGRGGEAGTDPRGGARDRGGPVPGSPDRVVTRPDRARLLLA